MRVAGHIMKTILTVLTILLAIMAAMRMNKLNITWMVALSTLLNTGAYTWNVLPVKIVQRNSRVNAKVFVPVRDSAVFEGRVEMDSHADTFVAGRNCIPLHFTERVCEVMPYSEDYETKKDIPIVQVLTGYTNIA